MAIVSPILLLIGAGVLEWGWHLDRLHDLVTLTYEAAHTGARATGVEDPVTLAEARIASLLEAEGYSSTDVSYTATIIDDATAGSLLTLDVAVTYEPFLGLVPLPDALNATATMRLEEQ